MPSNLTHNNIQVKQKNTYSSTWPKAMSGGDICTIFDFNDPQAGLNIEL